MSVYRVLSRNPYRGHEHGATFEASLQPREEERAVARGSIEVVERSRPSVKPGSYRLPTTRRTPQTQEDRDDPTDTDQGHWPDDQRR